MSWIKVTDKLPPENEWVLIYWTNRHYIVYWTYDDKDSCFDCKKRDKTWKFGEDYFNLRIADDHVWQPIPECLEVDVTKLQK